ncbi:hypothetical protein [Dactylococcopsis salina]|uniref:Uncharacterized protein n=2 Tax=Dactylococcopsis salina TaxID=292566 RepID=K9YTA7_DACS8|nr:hypothetical protein Dacsa_0560 [Dactylococcopsis salina PCC 8305]
MARYTCRFSVAIPLEHLESSLMEVLESCHLEMIYDTGEYLMAREVPNRAPFPKLVTAEVLIDRTTATAEEVRMNLVMKNEELPLQTNNHCRQMFDLMQEALVAYSQWQLLNKVAG